MSRIIILYGSLYIYIYIDIYILLTWYVLLPRAVINRDSGFIFAWLKFLHFGWDWMHTLNRLCVIVSR
jgi:hypothetical protein